jgi:DNA-binding response OmpR family regulator
MYNSIINCLIGGKMRILIVEDERLLADALAEILTTEKYMLDTVYNGLDGYNYARSGIYDCIILDCMLPKLDGLEIIKRLRAERIETPILMLTAKDSVKDKVNGLDAGADDYMTKPFSTEELLARLRTLTRRRGEIILNEISYSDTVLCLDTLELKSTRSGKVIRLSFKESEIIKILLTSAGIIVPKDDIIVRVWGYDSDATDNNVEAYISFLRKKLSFINSKCQINSIKKLGYKLEEATC